MARRRKKPDWDVDWFVVRWTWRKEWWVGFRRHTGCANLKHFMGTMGLLNKLTVGLLIFQLEWRWPRVFKWTITAEEIIGNSTKSKEPS